jgi:predicted DNA-binding WGR domain protein
MSLAMEVYRSFYDNGQPRKDWAVAIQNAEVVTRWGKSGSRLQGGNPVQRNGKLAYVVMENLIHEKEHGTDRYQYLGSYLVDDNGVVDWESKGASNTQAPVRTPSFNSDDFLAFLRKELLPADWTQKVGESFAGCRRYSVGGDAISISISHEGLPCMEFVARNRQLNVAIKRDQGPYGLLAALAVAKSLQALVVDNQDKPIVFNQPIQIIKSLFGSATPEMEETAYELGLLFRMAFRADAVIQSVSF